MTLREALHRFAVTYRPDSKESRKECLDKIIDEIEKITGARLTKFNEETR